VKRKLSQIGQIRTGIFAQPEVDGSVVYLQLRHFDEAGQLRQLPFPDLSTDELTEKHSLKRGDILFAAKGQRNFAAVFSGEFPAVASSSFLVVEVRDGAVTPEFLVWTLNSPTTQLFLKNQATGTALASISKSVLANLEIIVPPIEQQKRILEVSRLSDQEHALRIKIAELRRSQIQQAINKAIK